MKLHVLPKSKNEYSISRRTNTIDRDSGIDFDKEMKRIQKDFKKLLNEERQSQEELMNAFKVLGYEL
jgi:type I restriction enzyme M protein